MPKTLRETDILALAKQAVSANDIWAEQATYKAQQEGEGWRVSVWRIVGYDASGAPQFTSTGHRSITLDSEGRVTDYGRGR